MIIKEIYHTTKASANWFVKDIVAVLADIEPQPTKISEEKNRHGRLLYSPKLLNSLMKEKLNKNGWFAHKTETKPSYEFDFIKNKVGMEVQFGKYSFVFYDFAKGHFFNKIGLIDHHVEIVPMKTMKLKMSSGVPDFETEANRMKLHGDDYHKLPITLIGIDIN